MTRQISATVSLKERVMSVVTVCGKIWPWPAAGPPGAVLIAGPWGPLGPGAGESGTAVATSHHTLGTTDWSLDGFNSVCVTSNARLQILSIPPFLVPTLEGLGVLGKSPKFCKFRIGYYVEMQCFMIHSDNLLI